MKNSPGSVCERIKFMAEAEIEKHKTTTSHKGGNTHGREERRKVKRIIIIVMEHGTNLLGCGQRRSIKWTGN